MSTSARHNARQDDQRGDDGPIQFSTSKASAWSLANTMVAPERDIPWYQPFIVSASTAIFLVYFLLLREENDLDDTINKSLFETVPQLEEDQVKIALAYEQRQGRDTRALEKRLAEIQSNNKVSKSSSQ